MSFRVKSSKNTFILFCKLFSKGQIVQVLAISEGQEFTEGEHSKTEGTLSSAAVVISNIVSLSYAFLKQIHHLHLYEILQYHALLDSA